MATIESNYYATQKPTRANTSRKAAANIADGTVEFATFSYTLAGSETTSDIVKIGILPQGIIPVPQLSFVTSDGSPGTALTLKLGTAGDDDGWATAVALTSSARNLSCVNAGATQPAWVTPTPLVPDTGKGTADVYFTPTTATSLGTGVLTFTLAYKRGK